MDYSNVKLGMIDRFKVFLKRREAEKTEDERLKYEPNDDYNPDYSEAKQLEQELLSRKIAKLKAKEERRIAKQNKKEGVKLLAEAVYKEPVNQMEQYKMDTTPKYVPQVGTLDYALEQYLMTVLNQLQTGQKFDSRDALMSIGANSKENAGQNKENEERLEKKFKNRIDINFDGQFEDFDPEKIENGEEQLKKVFIHVNKNEHETRRLTKKLYLNCKRENIALLSENLIKNMDDMESFYFKFSTDYEANKKERSDKIVFFLEDEDELNQVLERIERTKEEVPELFEGSENRNPFMKSPNGYVGYARNYSTRNTYTSLLADRLSGCLEDGINQLTNSEVKIKDNERFLSATLSQLLSDDQKKIELISSMKKSLEREKGLDIVGIDTSISDQREKD